MKRGLQFMGCTARSCIFNSAQSLSRVRLFVTPWSAAHQAPPSMEFSRQEYWGGCHFLLQGILPTQGVNLRVALVLHCRWTYVSSITAPNHPLITIK